MVNNIHDELYEALADPRRRRLLFDLLADAPQTDIPIDFDTPPDDAIASKADRIEHQHVHLPKLDDCGFIEWTPEISGVEKGQRFDEIRPVLEMLASYHGKPPASRQSGERR